MGSHGEFRRNPGAAARCARARTTAAAAACLPVARWALPPAPREITARSWRDRGERRARPSVLAHPLTRRAPAATAGCTIGGMDDVVEHDWFEDFEWGKLEDGSMVAPHAPHSAKETERFFGPGGKAVDFDLPKYVGSQRWCDDWDYTCTVGTEVQDSKPSSLAAAKKAGALPEASKGEKSDGPAPVIQRKASLKAASAEALAQRQATLKAANEANASS